MGGVKLAAFRARNSVRSDSLPVQSSWGQSRDILRLAGCAHTDVLGIVNRGLTKLQQLHTLGDEVHHRFSIHEN